MPQNLSSYSWIALAIQSMSNSGYCPFFYVKDVTFIFQHCGTPCATCSGISTNCTSCGNDINGAQTYFNSSNLCSSSCDVSYYSSGTNFTCDLCDIACLNCTDLTNTSCSVCNNTGGYYFSSNSNTTCSVC